MISFYYCKPYTMEYLFNSPHFNYRLVTADDLQEFVKIYTNDLLMQHISEPLSKSQAKWLFSRFLNFNKARPQQHYLFTVTNKDTDGFVGFCGVNTNKKESDAALKTGDVGVILLQKEIGRGVGTEVLTALTKFSFEVLGFGKLIGPPSANNIASIRILEKAGYKQVCVLESHLTLKGERVDAPLFAIYRNN